MGNLLRIVFVVIVAAALTFTLVGIPLVLVWAGLVFIGQGGRLLRLEDKVSATLMTGERAIEFAAQKRLLALFHRRVGVAFTDSRIVIIRRGLLGGFRMNDLQWKDLEDVQIEENMISSLFGSNIYISYAKRPGANEFERVDGIDSRVAGLMYSYGQAQEHAWEEKRRVRELEEKRAMAGGITLHSQAASQFPPAQEAAMFNARETLRPASQSSNPILEELKRAKELLDGGVVTDAEFQEIKAKILSRML